MALSFDEVTNIPDIPKDSIMSAIFQAQYELAEKYAPIERTNGFYYPDEHHVGKIDDPQFQNWVRMMFWRATEELVEALEDGVPEINNQAFLEWGKRDGLRHFFEELADALHFVVEVSMFVGVSGAQAEDAWELGVVALPLHQSFPGDVHLQRDVVQRTIFSIVRRMGSAAHLLKNKPWKQRQIRTDHKQVRSHMLMIWQDLGTLWSHLGCDLKKVYVLYSKKHAVNVDRQATGY